MFSVKTNPYIEDLIKKTSPNGDETKSPIAIQFRHSDKEYTELPGEKLDYLGEDVRTHCDGLVIQKYPQRCLVYISNTCCAFCRHCTRKRRVQDNEFEISDQQLYDLRKYIEDNDIFDVLISGGDPLTLPSDKILKIVATISSALHNRDTKVIRMGSRVPVANPTIIMKRDFDFFKTLHDLGLYYLNTQFNCVEEITPEAIQAVRILQRSGIVIGNQSVLLKGVNDSREALKNLNLKLYEIGVRPYYLYSCDLIPGMGHFRVSLKRGIELYESLRGHISGLAMPLFIADLPDGMGKTPINPHYYKILEDGIYEFTNYSGRKFTYNDKEVTIGEY